jgi:hypothetical protein
LAVVAGEGVLGSLVAAGMVAEGSGDGFGVSIAIAAGAALDAGDEDAATDALGVGARGVPRNKRSAATMTKTPAPIAAK